MLGAQNPQFDLLIRNGHVIDARNGVDAVTDVAVAGGKIARVAANIDPSLARRVADASGLYVVPGSSISMRTSFSAPTRMPI